jgi:hypothetical protein
MPCRKKGRQRSRNDLRRFSTVRTLNPAPLYPVCASGRDSTKNEFGGKTILVRAVKQDSRRDVIAARSASFLGPLKGLNVRALEIEGSKPNFNSINFNSKRKNSGGNAC